VRLKVKKSVLMLTGSVLSFSLRPIVMPSLFAAMVMPKLLP
jgi:hypothetical protein